MKYCFRYVGYYVYKDLIFWFSFSRKYCFIYAKAFIGGKTVAKDPAFGLEKPFWKSTLINSLVADAAVGIIAQEVAGDVRMKNIRADKAECGITIKSTGRVRRLTNQVYLDKRTLSMERYSGRRNSS
ncbi:hypothetical protein V6N13_064132 [Hibiscus sabdariffa]